MDLLWYWGCRYVAVFLANEACRYEVLVASTELIDHDIVFFILLWVIRLPSCSARALCRVLLYCKSPWWKAHTNITFTSNASRASILIPKRTFGIIAKQKLNTQHIVQINFKIIIWRQFMYINLINCAIKMNLGVIIPMVDKN